MKKFLVYLMLPFISMTTVNAIAQSAAPTTTVEKDATAAQTKSVVKKRDEPQPTPMVKITRTIASVNPVPASTVNPTTVTIGTYKWNEVVEMVLLNHKKDAISIDDVSIVESKKGQLFNVISFSEEKSIQYAIIKVINYKSDEFYTYNFSGTEDEYHAKYRGKDNYNDKQLYFRVPVSFIEKYATKETYVKAGLTAGVINCPVKYRGQKPNIDWAGAFNVSAAIGYSFKHSTDNDWTFSVLVGVGISNITLDKESVKQHQDTLSAVNNFTAFSGSVGALVEYKKVQVGCFVGFDRLSNLVNKNFDWIYQGNPWFSIGLGYSIFSPQQPTEGSGKSVQKD